MIKKPNSEIVNKFFKRSGIPTNIFGRKRVRFAPHPIVLEEEEKHEKVI
jgi:hypothetical protein